MVCGQFGSWTAGIDQRRRLAFDGAVTRLRFVPDGGETSCGFSQFIDAVMMCWMSDLLMNGMAGSGRSFIPPGITKCIWGLELVFAPHPS
jgi:hypothetical protein